MKIKPLMDHEYARPCPDCDAMTLTVWTGDNGARRGMCNNPRCSYGF
jgi:hypothetical protein